MNLLLLKVTGGLRNISVVFLMILLQSCSTSQVEIPSGVIPHDKMVQVLADVQIAEATILYKSGKGDIGEAKAPAYYQYIFTRNKITEKQFRESFRFYLEQEELMNQLYEEVINEISKRQAEVVNK